MLVSARLSKRLYDQLGEELANDLVELLNQVDSTSRSELREINEQNFARFDARLEQRIAETNARIDKATATVNARIDTLAAEVNARIDTLAAEVNARIDTLAAELNARIDTLAAELNARIDTLAAELNARIDALSAEWNARFDGLVTRAELEKRFGEQDRYIAQQFAAQNRFLYLAMAMQLAATLSLWLR